MILNLKQYDVVLTTAFEFKYGICGHLFEMVDYYYAIKTYTDLTPCILLADGTTREEFDQAVKQKYDDIVIDNVVVHVNPRVVIANTIVVVDGSPRMKNADLLANNIFLFRCSESDFSYFTNTKAKVMLLQDYEIYDERYSFSVDYKKKILFSKYKHCNTSAADTAMFYLSTVCRAIPQSEIEQSIERHGFSTNIILTDNPSLYTLPNVYKMPVPDVWSKFSTYIYTAVPRKIDCSSRFILECLHYGKDIIYDIDYYDRALEVRKKDGLNGTSLLPNDYFLEILVEQAQR